MLLNEGLNSMCYGGSFNVEMVSFQVVVMKRYVFVASFIGGELLCMEHVGGLLWILWLFL